MLTFFTTAKPFCGHIEVIQRNALKSWTMLHPDVEIIIFGDDEGASEICREFGFRHEPSVERKANGTKSVRSIFGRAREIARHNRICYSNCDIILTCHFLRALDAVSNYRREFLMIGRRWDLDVTEPIDFSRTHWSDDLIERAHEEGFQRLYYNIDFFAFERNLYREFPDLMIGRNWWDQWLVWQAGAAGVPIIDVSDVVCAIHQNHDYAYHPLGMDGVWYDEATQENFRQAGGWRRLYTIEDARYRLTPAGIVPSRFCWLAPSKRRLRRISRKVQMLTRTALWHPFLGKTRSLRHALGLRQSVVGPLRRRKTVRRHWLDQ